MKVMHARLKDLMEEVVALKADKEKTNRQISQYMMNEKTWQM